MGKKSPAVPPPRLTWVQITVVDPNMAPVKDVQIEVWGLRLKNTGPSANRYKFSISEAEYDDIVAPRGNTVDVKVRKRHFGLPDPETKMCTPGENHQVFLLDKEGFGDFILVLQDAGLNRFTNLFEDIPARELTMLQARDAVLCLYRLGEIILENPPSFKHTEAEACDSACKVSSPLINEQVLLKAKFAGVPFRYIDFFPGGHILPLDQRDKVRTFISEPFLHDPRNLVGLYRLASMLKSKYGVTAVFHIGTSGFRGDQTEKKCHGQGRAFDFGGVRTKEGDLYILYEWGMQPVFDLTDPETDLTKKRRATSSNWPSKSMELFYRLEVLPPGGNATARAIFKDVYTFATEQYSDTSDKPTQHGVSKIGQKTQIMNADHFASHPKFIGPDGKEITPSDGREAHQNHIHFQIGSVSHEDLPPPTAG